MKIDEEQLQEIIRRVIAEHLAVSAPAFTKKVDTNSGVITVKTATVSPAPFACGKPGAQVFLQDVVSIEESPRMMFGVMEMKAGTSFDWTLRYDEIDYIIDGTLDIIVDGRTSRAEKGDTIFIPKDSSITFATPDAVRFLYVTYPANWAEQ